MPALLDNVGWREFSVPLAVLLNHVRAIAALDGCRPTCLLMQLLEEGLERSKLPRGPLLRLLVCPSLCACQALDAALFDASLQISELSKRQYAYFIQALHFPSIRSIPFDLTAVHGRLTLWPGARGPGPPRNVWTDARRA
jgi:hypothetical protein